MGERIAIIDLGTNTFHLLMAEVEGKIPRILYREKQAVKLGLKGINEGVITEEAIQRAMDCIGAFKNTLSQWNVSRVQALGTSALRSARNGPEVIQKIKRETGIDVNLISGDQEAEYIYYGVRFALNLGLEKSLIMDIGGGSVEFIIGNRQKPFWKQSFDIGAQRLLEQFQKHDPILPEEIMGLHEHFEATLTSLHDAIQKHKPLTLVGSSGTFDTLSEIHCVRQHLSILPNASETPLTLDAFNEISKEIISKNRAERLKIPGMIEMRVDMIVVACCLIRYLMTHVSFRKVRVSSFSLKEGVLASLTKIEPT